MDEYQFYVGLMIASGVIAVAIFILLFFISAPYGRHIRKGWGPTISSKLGWIIMESPAIIVFAVIYAISDRRFELVPIIFFFIWMAHYVQRDLIYPLFLRTNKRMTVLIMIFGLLFQISNTYLQARWLYHFASNDRYTQDWVYDPRFIVGIIVFIVGYFINRHSDFILRNLRKPGEKGYKIPYGGLFRYVSSPNYFGELVIWFGWAIAVWSWPAFLFAMWTLANLLPRAKSNHDWYKDKFPDYPKERKAIIPFIF